MLRQPQVPGLLWQLRRGADKCISPSALPHLLYSEKSSSRQFPDGVSANIVDHGWCLQSASGLRFHLDLGYLEGSIEKIPLSFLLGDAVNVIPNETGFVEKEEVVR